ncbi:MAG: hypothetical protein ACTS1X_02090 [Parasphingopyxis sp.]|uniref:hypothetical protein n=1 Tax=Parasphingopyxis sp. TaxID=1920299 RepID=UPI003FA005AD
MKSLIESTALPAPKSEWFDYSYHLLSDGKLAIFRTDRNIRQEQVDWFQKAQSAESFERMPNLWTGEACLLILSCNGSYQEMTIPLVRHPLIDRFPDGHWLVTSTRAERDEKNATVLFPDGQRSHSFSLGDGIEHVRCASDDTIWVGYFDEGVFGNTIGAGGIVQFDWKGKWLWKYNDAQSSRKLGVSDCYALSTNGTEVWSCFYHDFAITRISNGDTFSWKNGVAGAKALAVKDNQILLLGGYGADRDRIALLALKDGEAALSGTTRWPGEGEILLVQGQSDVMHVVRDGLWSRIAVSADLVEIQSLRI